MWIYGQRVPIVVWAPDVIDPQDHVERVMLADLAPTVQGFTGLTQPLQMTGRTLTTPG